MSHTPNDLRDEFPDAVDILHQLKVHDAHFAKLAERYHDLNREIHRVESDVEAASDERIETLKKQRLAMLDDISTMVAKAKAV